MKSDALAEGTTLLQDAVLGDLTRPLPVGEKAETGVKRKRAMVCCICGGDGKYRCPGCGRETCSVGCVKEHKEKWACDGKRKPRMVCAEEYDETTLYEDYFFLEKFVDVVKGFKKNLPGHQPFSLDTLPTPLHYLREASKIRGLHLTIQSKGLTRNADNISRFISKTDTILWRMDFQCHTASGEIVRFSRLVNERHRVKDVMENYSATRERKLRKMQVWNKHWEMKKRKREYLILRDGATADDLEGLERGEHTGTVARWDEDRGYGFIAMNDKQIFVHRKELRIIGGGSLQRGQEVHFDIVTEPDPSSQGSERTRASNVSGPGVVPVGSLTRHGG
eukprot:TRINITY_DN23207_c0_g1_i1.p1 TRINITY_DN23207_c0_g1~~TRINITY_DN23207_c0_g1_i1.p1  ORF type:complete len:335 (+),score=61.05 TRINITY_DN23207_c0_g1_i1:55-1059(+)